MYTDAVKKQSAGKKYIQPFGILSGMLSDIEEMSDSRFRNKFIQYYPFVEKLVDLFFNVPGRKKLVFYNAE